MATKAFAKPISKPTPKKPSTELANWDEELAAQAAQAAEVEASTATGQMFSTKSGQLSFNDAPLDNNQMAVVVADAILENVYYGSDYDADNPKGPLCWAFGRDEDNLAPHEVAVKAGTSQAKTCAECEHNVFGSADKGKGKACRNIRRLALIPAGSLDKHGAFEPFETAEEFETSAIGFLKLPVTSVKGYSAFVKTTAGALRRPLHGIFTKIKVVPDAKSQFKVVFEVLAKVPNEVMRSVMERHNEAKVLIDFSYSSPSDEETTAKPVGRGKTAAKPTANPAPGRRKF